MRNSQQWPLCLALDYRCYMYAGTLPISYVVAYLVIIADIPAKER